MNWPARWNPRLHLSAAVGWAVFLLLGLASVVAASIAANEAEGRARSDAQQLLAELAAQSQQMLESNLKSHRQLVQATAGQIAASQDRGADALQRHLEALQVQFPEFAWLGASDLNGRVMVGTAGRHVGDDLAVTPWFKLGRKQARVDIAGDANPAPRFIDVTAPLPGARGVIVGVVGAQLSWSWLEQLQSAMIGSLGPQRGIELVLTSADGAVLAGPARWLGRHVASADDLAESGDYLVGIAPARGNEAGLPIWTEHVLQPAAEAMAPALAVRRAVFGVVLLAGLFSALAAVLLTRTVMRRLSLLAEQAQAVHQGIQTTLTAPRGDDEIGRIGATLSELVAHLQREKRALLELNRDLDARVLERTERIEQLADESRHAAVTRERLRLARDLHDTLAHSMMALLTQIRLVRKLHTRLDPAALAEEIDRAEAVATSGLTEARAAITQIRASSVRDAGLGAELKGLLARHAERTGTTTTLDLDSAAADSANARAESAFRIAEEALRNIEKHARASHVVVTLHTLPPTMEQAVRPGEMPPAKLRLTIADDGVGFDTDVPHTGHYGLQGMHEHAALMGAELAMESRPGAGTRIVLDFET